MADLAALAALRLSGAEFHLKGEYAEAVERYEEALSHDACHLSTIVNLAWSHLEMGTFRRCIKMCDVAIGVDADCPEAYILKGRAQHAMKKKKAAMATWKKGAKCFGSVALMRALRDLIEGREAMPTVAPLATKSPASAEAAPAAVKKPQPTLTGNETASKDGMSLKSASAVGGVVDNSALVARKGLVQNGVGDVRIDERIARGYLQVNTGKLMEAVKTFNTILEEVSPPPVGAFLGRGTAFAIGGNLTQAIADFSDAISLDENSVEAWKRRGQARAANGSLEKAVEDLTQAITLKRDSDGLHQRGLVYHKMKNFRRALADFDAAIELDASEPSNWNHAGICLTTIGKSKKALDYLHKAVQLNPRYKEAFLNLGQAHKELGDFENANSFYSKAIAVDSNYHQAYYLRGVAKHSAGRHHDALADFKAAVKAQPDFAEAAHMVGVMQHGLGMAMEAYKSYESCLQLPGKGVVSLVLAYYNKEVVSWLGNNLDKPLASFNFDVSMDPYFKEAWCKRKEPASVQHRFAAQPPPQASITYQPTPLNEEAAKLLAAAKIIGPKLQLQCAGYLPNARQWKMCGFAAIEIAQHLKRLYRQEGYEVSGAWSSKRRTPHQFYWRDMYDVVVRWRQFSEPNDPVVWVDLLSPEQFAEGFGSHTPMITQQTEVVRYYPLFERSFKIMKGLISQTGISYAEKTAFEKAKDCKEAYAILRRDFWVCTPCHSLKTPGKVYEGTRLTMQYVHPEGYEYSIRTPGTPARWVEYDEEMDHVWSLFAAEARKPASERDLDRVSDLILTLTYFWYNFMPLARGTAACGYVALLGMFLSLDIDIDTLVPKGFQVDWEGILTPVHSQFVDAVKPWMYPARKKTTMLDELPLVADSMDTLRKLLSALNCD